MDKNIFKIIKITFSLFLSLSYMRIRKNGRVLELMVASSSYPIYQTTPHFCQLNQSPWDFVSTNSTNHQLQLGECSLSGDASIESMKRAMAVPEDEDVDPISSMGLDCSSTQMVKKQIRHVENNNDSEELKMSKNGNFSPQHDIKNNSVDSKNNNLSAQKSGKPIISGVVRRRGRPPGKKTLSMSPNLNPNPNPNPDEFYYYTGFGPLWAKRRGDNKINNVEKRKEDSGSSSSDESEHDENDVGKDVELMEEDSSDENGRKRGRKPIKARSLKSLM